MDFHITHSSIAHTFLFASLSHALSSCSPINRPTSSRTALLLVLCSYAKVASRSNDHVCHTHLLVICSKNKVGTLVWRSRLV
ncbi:hypothetical protein OUZ56_007618 [Daphnia magna]|uniref:Secreted protein n=1 Tax=Daphnia magna TaxID=35525 RepID=A0ABR0AAJ4_9CRUS|nr:hypothetical protein OUZ56_007618 [Daphnia magna]